MWKVALGGVLFLIVAFTVFVVVYEAKVDHYILDKVLRNSYDLKKNLVMKEIDAMYGRAFLVSHFLVLNSVTFGMNSKECIANIRKIVRSEKNLLRRYGFSKLRFGSEGCPEPYLKGFSPSEEGGEFFLGTPVLCGDRNVGCLFVSFGMDYIRRMLSMAGQQYVIVLVRRDAVPRVNRGAFRVFPLDPDFYVSRKEMNAFGSVIERIRSRVNPRREIAESEHFIFYSVPLELFNGRRVGYFLFVDKKPEMLEGMVRVYVFAGLGVLVVFFMGMLVLVIYRGYVRVRMRSRMDYLTQILNREACLKEARSLKRFSVIFFDIDHFKSINDTYGHDRGDEVLRGVSGLISRNIRKSDIFCRFGGEEFMIILPNTSVENAAVIAEKLRKMIEGFDFCGVRLTISIGVAYGEAPVEKVIERADRNLYRAKREGRNMVVVD